MSTQAFDSILLNGLIIELKAAGYTVPVEHVLAIQTILLSVSLNELELDELKYLVAPLIAKSPEEQTDIHNIVDIYIARETFRQRAPAKSQVYNYNDIQPGTFKFRSYKKTIISVWIIALVLACFTWVIRQTMLQHAFTDNLPVFTSSSDTIKKDSTGYSIPAPVAPVNKIAPKKAEEKPTGFLVEGLHAIPAKEKNINLQLSVILGIITGVILGFVVFRVKEPNYAANDNAENKAGLQSGSDGIQTQHQQAQQHTGKTIALPVLFNFLNSYHLIRDSSIFSSIKRNLRRPGIGNSLVFDTYKSITATARQGGIFSPAYTYPKQQRKYLVLVDESNIYDPVANLFNFFIQRLITAGLYIEKFSWQNNIQLLTDTRGNKLSLREVADNKPGYHLLIWGEGSRLLNKENIFSAWPSRAIITPTCIWDWGANEYRLQNEGFAIVPADSAAIDLLVKHITGRQDISRNTLQTSVTDVYSIKRSSFGTAEDIYKYLQDEVLFKLVCALAIHPRLDWNITIRLYNALVKKQSSEINLVRSDYDTLLKIARMPVLHTATLDDNLRLHLLYSLDRRTEMAARQTILAALNEATVQVQANTIMYEDLKQQILLNQFFLYAGDRKANKNYAPAKSEILHYWNILGDTVMKEYISSGKAAIMPKASDGSHLNITEFLVTEYKREVTKVNVLRVMATFIPALVIYLLLVTFKPAFAFPGNKYVYGQTPVTLVFKKDSCTNSIDSVSIKGNALEKPLSIATDKVLHSETILENMDYDVPVTIEYNYKGEAKTTIINCTDSLYIITLANCAKNK